MKTADLLTAGLMEGYATEGQITSVERAGFKGKQSHLETPEGDIYHDEWFAGTLGGGQELVKAGGDSFTRLYLGGAASPEVLEALGITKKDVSNKLKEYLQELKDKTRLFSTYETETNGGWQYKYTVLEQYPDFNVTTAREVITYRQTAVHLHTFMLCPIR